jgi:transcriptional antiterminator NusG
MTIEGPNPVTEDVNRIDAATAGDEARADDAVATPDLDELAAATGSPNRDDVAEEQRVAEAADADLVATDEEYAAPDDATADDTGISPDDDAYLEMESMQGDGELPIDMGHDVQRRDDATDEVDAAEQTVTSVDIPDTAVAEAPATPEEPAAPVQPATPEEPAAPVEPAAPQEPAASDASADDEVADAASDPFRGPGDWYVVHTYAGYENKVKTNLESRIHTMQMEDKIFRVHIPMEDVMEIKSGKKQVVQKKVFPGYLLVKMYYDNDSWYVVRNTPGVTGFVSSGTGSKPTPLSKREIEKILVVKKEEAKPAVRLGFDEGDVVRITSGPFADFNGTISEINADQAKLKVLVNIFDRETPVELSFDQVAKV